MAYEGAITWLKDNLKKHKGRAKVGVTNEEGEEQLKIGLTGDLIGGSLALALGLTECRITDAARVVAVSVREPILDWVFEHDVTLQRDATASAALADNHTDSIAELKRREEAVDAFWTLRHCSFPGRYPYRYFDPFASPMHFLRSPASRIPNLQPGAQAMEVAGYDDLDEDPLDDEVEEEQIRRIVGAPEPSLSSSESPSSNGSTASESGSESAGPPVKRPMSPNDPRRFKRPLRYPPSHCAPLMVLPRLQIATHPQSQLRPQAEDFIRLLRRGLLRGQGYKMSRNIEKMITDESLLTAEEGKHSGQEMQDERLALIRQGWEQFQLHTAISKDADDVRTLAAWLQQ